MPKIFNPTRLGLATRVILAVLGLGAVLGVAGRNLAPDVATTTWLFWCALGLGGLVLTLTVGVVITLQINQWVLRNGGTDVQWLAFPSDPKGLVALRQKPQAAPAFPSPEGPRP